MRFNTPPNWPPAPAGWSPPPGWLPDPAWGPPPAGWRLWIDDQPRPAATPPPGQPPITQSATPLPGPARTQVHTPPPVQAAAPFHFSEATAPPQWQADPLPQPRQPPPHPTAVPPHAAAPQVAPPFAPAQPPPGPMPGPTPQQSGRSPALQNTLKALGILGTILMGLLTVVDWIVDKIEPAIYAAVGIVAAYFAITDGIPALFIVTALAAGAIFLYFVFGISWF